MNVELRQLLRVIDPAFGNDSRAWTRVTVVRNIAAIGTAAAGASEGGGGFKLLVTDRRGVPQWVGRCLGLGDPPGWLTGDHMVELSRDPVAGAHVPEVRTAESANLRLVLTAYLGATSLRSLAERMRPEAWGKHARAVAEVADRVTARAGTINPALLAALTVSEQERRLARDLLMVGEAMPEMPIIEILRPFLARYAELPFRLQHGDLWSQNVFWHSGRWWLIDFDECGEFYTPLHDRFHLLSAAPRAATERPWFALRVDQRPDDWGRARAAVLRDHAAQLGLDDGLVGLSLVAYLVHLIGFRMRPPLRGLFTARLIGKLTRISTYLSEGGAIEALVPLR